MVRMVVRSRGNVLDRLKQDLPGNRITALTDVISGDVLTWFIVAKIDPNEGVEGIAIPETANVTELTD